MILKTVGKKSKRSGLIQLTKLDGFCCGDKDKAVVCSYELTMDTGDTPVIAGIVIAGSEYYFPYPITVASDAGVDDFKNKVYDILAAMGYSPDGIEYTRSGNLLTITTDYSLVSFDLLYVGTYTVPAVETIVWTKSDCKVIGNLKSDCCDVEMVYRIELLELDPEGSPGTLTRVCIAKPVSCQLEVDLTLTVINGVDTEVVWEGPINYTATPVAGLVAGSWSVNGVIQIDVDDDLGLTEFHAVIQPLDAAGCCEKSVSYECDTEACVGLANTQGCYYVDIDGNVIGL